jgi:hypothetical protein
MTIKNIKAVSFKHDGIKFKAQLRRDGDKRKGIAYVWNDEKHSNISPEKFVGPYAKILKLPHVYTKKGDHPIIDKAFALMNKLIVDRKTEVLNVALEALGDEYAKSIGKWKFSRKAGCACGCSPGFTTTDESFAWKSIYIEEVK